MFVVWLSRTTSVFAPKPASPWEETRQMVPRFLLMFLTLVLTGGIRSPLLPAVLIPFSDLVIKSGFTRAAKNILVILGSGLALLAGFPRRRVCTDLAQPRHLVVLLPGLPAPRPLPTRFSPLLSPARG